MYGFSFKNFNKKNLLLLLELMLLLLCLKKVKGEDCITHSYLEFNYLKAITLDNEYKVIVTKTGIYSFYPKLSSIAYSYNFTGDQILSEGESLSFINNADLSQFSGEEGGNKYILCLIKQTVYVMSEKGNLLFYKDIDDDLLIYQSSTLVAYKYLDNEYFFTIGFVASYSYSIRLFYFKITFYSDSEGDITEISYIDEKPSYNERSFWVNSNNLSCQQMSESNNEVLICFAGFSDVTNYIAAFKYNPDNEITLISMSNSIADSDGKKIEYIKSSINNEKTKALICYTIEGSIGRCLYYFINENKLYEVFINSNFCSSFQYGLNVYFFPKSNEYIFSCVDDLIHFYMMRIDSNFNIIEDNTFNGIQFDGVSNYNTFSIIYISQYNVYSAIMSSKKDSQQNMRIFMLSKSTCEMPSGVKEDDEIPPKTIPKFLTTIPELPTTIPLFLTTVPELPTTIPLFPTTIPELPTTIPLFPTTIPKLQTTIPEIITTIITTLPIIETTIQNIITTIPLVSQESTIIQEIKTSIPQVISSFLTTISIIPERKENIESNTELLCKDNDKIYYEGKCICNKNKGYFSINSKFSENKCYKKNELPKKYILMKIPNLMNYVIKLAPHVQKEVVLLKIIV